MFNNFDIVEYLIGILVIFLSISVHEYAHARAAYGYGDDTAYNAGRLTFNPIKHFEPFGLILILMGAPVAWGKPVPVNSSKFRSDVNYKRATLWVSLAGIVANLILAVIAAAVYTVLLILFLNGILSGGFITQVMSILITIAMRLIGQNVVLAVFNFLPVPPLDGFELFSRVLPRKTVMWLRQNQQIIGMVFIFAIVFFNRQFGIIISTISGPIINVILWPFNQLLQLFV